ncbi:LytR/AlgR family response regulator transcription factor [Aquimarina sp. 2201CG14-23]|uniref:LytR/AlgR family response regulator transcription factor n=1 Tax=Aquimarina mycalae TaxID=3040073 RepID=UPI002477FE1C|nr:LytTR family DNA-binding domain-containing protein [Aquimarina sp. 2201CG14-23]
MVLESDSVEFFIKKGDSLNSAKNLTLAEDAYEKAFRLAKRIGDKKQILDTGFKLERYRSAILEKHDEAKEIIDFINSYCTKLDDKDCIIQSIIRYGELKRRKLQFVDALKRYSQALLMAEKTENKNLNWQILTGRGGLLLDIGDLDQSKRDFKKAVDYITDIKGKYMTDKLKCIIIDDEKKDRENIHMLLDSYCPQVEVIGEAKDRATILSVLSELKPDLVFIDIQLGAISVFDVLNELDSIEFKIVFVTAFDKYAIQGYQYDAIDYLLKPVDPKRLIKVVDKTFRLKDQLASKENIANDFKELYSKVMETPKISITDAKGVHIVKAIDVLYCVSDGNYTTFVMKDENEIVISKNLKHFESKLKDYNFFRIHKSYLVNLNHIDFLVKEQGGSVVMKNGKSLPISRNGKKELYEKMNIL